MTHGEAWFAKIKSAENLPVDKEGYMVYPKGIPYRMGYSEAVIYYSKKFRLFFEQQLAIKDFDKVEDYFGYYEAIKIRNLIEKL